MQGKKVMGKGLAKVEKHGVMSAGVPGSKKQVPGKVGGSLPKAGKSETATSKKAQPVQFSGVAAPRAAGFTKFVN